MKLKLFSLVVSIISLTNLCLFNIKQCWLWEVEWTRQNFFPNYRCHVWGNIKPQRTQRNDVFIWYYII